MASSRQNRRRGALVAGVLALLAMASTGLPQVAGATRLAGGGTLTVAIPGDVSDYDPLTNGLDVYDNIGRLALFDSLTRLDAQMRTVPDLATSWSTTDGKTWTFHLRSGVRWHDGKPLTASDVQYTMRRLVDPKVGSYIANLGANIARVDAPDARTVRIALKAVDASFANTLVYISIVPNGSGARTKLHPVGTGPFSFVSWSPNDQIVLKANPAYWAGAPAIGQLVLKPVPDPNTALLDLRGGSVDIISSITPAMVRQVQHLSGAMLVTVNPSTELDYVDFVASKPPLNNPLVRQALAMCMDLGAVKTLVYGGLGQPSNNFIAPSSPFYAAVPNYTYNPGTARRLLARAGYPHGFSLTIDQLQGYPALNQEAVIWQAGLQQAGIRARLRMNEISAWINRFGKSDYQATMDTDVQGPDPNRFFLISFAYHYSQGDYKNKSVIDLGNAADATLQMAQRKALYARLQRVALQDLPVLPLYRAPLLSVERTGISGYVLNGKGFYGFDRVTLHS